MIADKTMKASTAMFKEETTSTLQEAGVNVAQVEYTYGRIETEAQIFHVVNKQYWRCPAPPAEHGPDTKCRQTKWKKEYKCSLPTCACVEHSDEAGSAFGGTAMDWVDDGFLEQILESQVGIGRMFHTGNDYEILTWPAGSPSESESGSKRK